jgi:hypothetical protein
MISNVAIQWQHAKEITKARSASPLLNFFITSSVHGIEYS